MRQGKTGRDSGIYGETGGDRGKQGEIWRDRDRQGRTAKDMAADQVRTCHTPDNEI